MAYTMLNKDYPNTRVIIFHHYYTRKNFINSDKEDIKRAVEYMVKVHKEKHKVILDLYNEFNNEYEINNPK